MLVEPAKTDVIRGEVLPPWMQPVFLCLDQNPSSAMQVTDLWTHGMRKLVVKDLFPKKVKSKVGAAFHDFYQKEEKKKLFRRFSRSVPEGILSDRGPIGAGLLNTPRLKINSTRGPEPEHISTRFPPVRSLKKLSKPTFSIGRPN